jgi:hypothetical protein
MRNGVDEADEELQYQSEGQSRDYVPNSQFMEDRFYWWT